MKLIELVLLIDDSTEDNYFHRRALTKSGLVKNIVECIDGEDALHYLKKEGKYFGWDKPYHVPDIIFLDINMPKVDGFEFLDGYKRLPDEIKKGMVIIMLSTSQNPVDKEKADGYREVVDFITKPLDEEEINRIVNAYFS